VEKAAIFGIVACPDFIREWMQIEKESQAA